MQKIVINFEAVGNEFYCPFCGAKVMDREGLYECPHLLLHACEDGYSYLREDIADIESKWDDAEFESYLNQIEQYDCKDGFVFVLRSSSQFSIDGYVGFSP